MPSRLQPAQPWLRLLALLLVAHSSVSAQGTQSLAERRLGIIKGTAPGIVLFDFGAPAPSAAAPASTTTTAPAPAGVGASASKGSGATPEAMPSGTKTTEAPAYQQPIGNRLLGNLPPPSGRSLQSARRLDAPDQGVQLPTKRDTPAPTPPPEPQR